MAEKDSSWANMTPEQICDSISEQRDALLHNAIYPSIRADVVSDPEYLEVWCEFCKRRPATLWVVWHDLDDTVSSVCAGCARWCVPKEEK